MTEPEPTNTATSPTATTTTSEPTTSYTRALENDDDAGGSTTVASSTLGLSSPRNSEAMASLEAALFPDDGRLTLYNYLNVVAYIANISVTYSTGVNGSAGRTNREISEIYATLVTPAGWTFSIWSIIFISQAIFTIVQLLPEFRSKPQVQQGVKYHYALACFFQITWCIIFAREKMWWALLLMICILTSLLLLVDSQYSSPSDKTPREFWLLRFPFAIHTGWIIAATVLSLNVLMVSRKASPQVQVTFAIISLFILVTFAIFVLFFPKRPNWVISATLAWASAGIYSELGSPAGLILAWFDSDTIAKVRWGAGGVCLTILLVIAYRLYLFYNGQIYNIKQVRSEDALVAVQAAQTPQENQGVGGMV